MLTNDNYNFHLLTQQQDVYLPPRFLPGEAHPEIDLQGTIYYACLPNAPIFGWQSFVFSRQVSGKNIWSIRIDLPAGPPLSRTRVSVRLTGMPHRACGFCIALKP
ncbi:hypothetical protein [Rhizobium laguerreae]|uniref:hypothetical protein n=1 Tax=Rhizobium laguerreae TaxID=1076926 RepID=UPI001C9160B6|nr:hypothetical protein [Rhizobium laguerreae]MBY3116404.1 hypothetical protein [Rhizobium laguerreae]MBY3187622.1 hypothetical protein [Rhizobium laguerreae]